MCFLLLFSDATVYVGGLDEKVSEAILWELFLQAGPVGKIFKHTTSNFAMPAYGCTGTTCICLYKLIQHGRYGSHLDLLSVDYLTNACVYWSNLLQLIGGPQSSPYSTSP
jgi:hypothetical protein